MFRSRAVRSEEILHRLDYVIIYKQKAGKCARIRPHLFVNIRHCFIVSSRVMCHIHDLLPGIGYLRTARGDNCRDKIRPLPVENLRAALKSARNAAESAGAIALFLEEEGVWENLRKEEEALLERQMYREALVNRRVWKLLMDLLDQMQTLLGRRKAAIRDLDYGRVKAIIDIEMTVPAQMREDIELQVMGRCPVYEYGRSGGCLLDDDGVLEAIEGFVEGGEA